jgi:rhamnosyltransferase
MLHPKVSVIIRTRNEQAWLASCLQAVCLQDYRSAEVIIVDNDSNDHTLAVARQFGCRIVHYPSSTFNYSKALNLGIHEARGEYIVMLSGHCIPVNERWLTSLAMHFSDPKTIAAYGRQIPTPDSAPEDKRDLWVTFGLDRKIQKRDFFLHNANSMIRRKTWETQPFNENIHGVEDQDWARKVLKEPYRIVYEPLAAVFHQHGIHHGGNKQRTMRVVKFTEMIHRGMT